MTKFIKLTISKPFFGELTLKSRAIISAETASPLAAQPGSIVRVRGGSTYRVLECPTEILALINADT